MRVPIAPGLWTDEAEPRLIGGRNSQGRIVFPMPDGDAADGWEPVPLSRTGTLWSWTRQDFEPKRPPYAGPVPFVPYLIGYVELADEVIVIARLVDIDAPVIGMPLGLRIVPFAGDRALYAFGPVA